MAGSILIWTPGRSRRSLHPPSRSGNAGVRRDNSRAGPVRQVLSTASLRLLLGCTKLAEAAGITSFFVYLPTFATQELKLPAHAAFYSLLVSNGVAIPGELDFRAHIRQGGPHPNDVARCLACLDIHLPRICSAGPL
jgi:hypothetical protein